MGRAIVRDPKAFLSDESLSNLDAKLRVQMRVEIRRLCRRLGTTSLYVTHDQVEAMTMADRIVVLHAGRVQQTGTPEKVYARPANRFVAGFIGSPPMNFIEGTVRRTESGWELAAGDGTLALPQALGDRAGEGNVTLGMRPEALALGRPGPDHVALDGEVVLSELLGKDRILTVETALGTLAVILPGAENAAGRVTLACPADAVHLFRE
jgi:ABC-type sugar transport system ATPase subunit